MLLHNRKILIPEYVENLSDVFKHTVRAKPTAQGRRPRMWGVAQVQASGGTPGERLPARLGSWFSILCHTKAWLAWQRIEGYMTFPIISLLHNLVEPMDVGKYCPYCRPSYALMIASRATSSSSLYILTLIPISLIMFFMVLAITKSPNRLLNAENTISTSHRRP